MTQARDELADTLRGFRDGFMKGNPRAHTVLLSPAELRVVFPLVEESFAEGGWEAVEAALAAIPEFAEPTGALGPLWIATQMELGRDTAEIRVAVEIVLVAADVAYNLNERGRMRYLAAIPS